MPELSRPQEDHSTSAPNFCRSKLEKCSNEHCGESLHNSAEGKALGYSLKRIEIARSLVLATFKPLNFHEIQALRDDLAAAIQDETGKVDS